MSNVVRFPAKRPNWLLLVHGRLMVKADRPLTDLHRMARLAGIPRDQYRPGLWPYYRLTPRSITICSHIFGKMLGEAFLDTAMNLADRRRAKKADPRSNVP